MSIKEEDIIKDIAIAKWCADVSHAEGYQALHTLSRRGYNQADYFVEEFKAFNKDLNKEWDELYRKYGIDHIYKLPQEELDRMDEKYGKRLQGLLNEAYSCWRIGYIDIRLYMAVKIICLSDYGFLRNYRLKKGE